MNRTTLALCAVASCTIALVSPAARAQNSGLRNSARMVHTMCGGGPGGDTFLDTGVVPAGPLVTASSVAPTDPCGCHSDLSVMMTSDYGSLSYTANASGSSCSCCGIFVWIDQGSGDSKSRFFDRLTVQSGTLPAGSPVAIRASLHLLGGASASNPTTEQSFSGVMDILGPVNHNMVISDGQGTTTREFTVNVGQWFDVNARIYSIMRDRVLMNFNQTGAFAVNLNLAATFEILTPNASLSSASGHNYTPQIPCTADLDDGSGSGTPDNAVDINDLLFFLSAFEAGSVDADLDNGSGTSTTDNAVDINDLLYFLVRFEAGC